MTDQAPSLNYVIGLFANPKVWKSHDVVTGSEFDAERWEAVCSKDVRVRVRRGTLSEDLQAQPWADGKFGDGAKPGVLLEVLFNGLVVAIYPGLYVGTTYVPRPIDDPMNPWTQGMELEVSSAARNVFRSYAAARGREKEYVATMKDLRFKERQGTWHVAG